MFHIEPFDYVKHIQRVLLMELCPESLEEVNHSPLVELGFCPKQIVLDALISSDEAYVFVHSRNYRIMGVCGAAHAIRGGTTVIIPWFLTDGFERRESNRWKFLRISRDLLRDWERMAPGKTFENICLNVPRITKWLKWLGFTVEETAGRFARFEKKGGNSCVHLMSLPHPQ